ncbi:hypothetical protein OG497_37485 [Streptomyces sp. NBC_01242]|uniref:hypothetical protein n=1 Tax=Streptomyces sp. NBC_01242 TaxID=2903795 RepID=UPI002250BE98|nr:hypothetical protein [Streptomyces sp. NBC_01242]MCX4799552.1 hypothetical protein [Streptomyces sp. NBC_01242]
MTTPTPNNQGLTGALQKLTMQLQAMLHQNQTLNNLPSSARQYLQQARQQVLNPAALLGGQVPPPAAPTAQWMNQAAASLLSQVVLNQPNRGIPPLPTQGRPSGAGPTPPTTPPVPPAPHAPAPNPYTWGYPGYPGYPGGGSGGGYNGPYPGPYPGPLVAPQHSGVGGGSGGASTGIGSWARSSLPRVGMMIGGPWGAVAGAAVAAATQLPAEIRSQRDKNAYYQSIEGGSNFDGFAERAHEEAYRWTTFGVLSSEESRKAFKGVTKLGYNSKVEDGIGRQEALDFVYHGKTRRGATVDESLQTLQVNSKNALGSLNDLNDALNSVSDSAGKAGVNAQMARAEFTQLMDQAIKGGYGSSAAQVAAGEQGLKNSYGRSFQDMDVSGRLTMGHAYMSASMSGMSVSDYLTAGVTGKMQADSKLDQAAVQNVLKPGVENWIKEQIAKSGGAGSLSEGVCQQIAEEMMRTFYQNDAPAVAMAIATISGNRSLIGDPVKAFTWLVQQYNEKGAATTVKDLSKADKKKQKEISEKNSVATNVGEMQRVPMAERGPNAGKSKLGKDLDREHSGGFLGFGGHNSDAYNAYQKWHKKNDGQEDPVVYHLLNKIKGDNKSKVAVTTKDGKKVVSLADAVKRHRNELASGKAVIVEGDQAGKSVKDILGEKGVDPLRDFSKEAASTEKGAQSYEAWEKAHTKKDKKGNEKLEIGLTTEARRLLTVMDSTGVSGSSATATPPLSPYASNPSYQE